MNSWMNRRTGGAAVLAALLLLPGAAQAKAPTKKTAKEPTKKAMNKPAKAQIPASGDAAQKALTASPRHGEWVNVPMEEMAAGSETKIRSWVVYPERRDKAPVVIVIHEIFGLTDWIRAVADQLAADGFIAVAPDLLSGMGPNGGGTDSFPADEVRSAIRNLSPDEVTRRLNAVRRYALAQPAAGKTFATIGFCWGGSMSFMYATRQPDLDAAVVYYGTAPTEKEALANIKAPVLGFYGEDDARVTATVEGTTQAMKELKKPYTTRIYTGAGHGFLRQQEGRENANLKAARQAWAETIRFLRTHLK